MKPNKLIEESKEVSFAPQQKSNADELRKLVVRYQNGFQDEDIGMFGGFEFCVNLCFSVFCYIEFLLYGHLELNLRYFNNKSLQFYFSGLEI